MPAKQRGSVVKRGHRNHQARWYDENGNRRARSGFETETAAWQWLRPKVDEVSVPVPTLKTSSVTVLVMASK